MITMHERHTKLLIDYRNSRASLYIGLNVLFTHCVENLDQSNCTGNIMNVCIVGHDW